MRLPLAMALWLCSAAQAQQQPLLRPARIVGVVLTATGAPVRDAIAVLDSVRYRQTDARGRFQYDSLALGNHRLEVRSIGYSPVAAVIRLAAGTADVAIRLKSGVHLLPEVLVKARNSLDLTLAFSRLPGFHLKDVGILDSGVVSQACPGFSLWINGWEIDTSDIA